jgi:ATP-dependent protease HslVU (ClpYQ) peptidase subunit
MDGLTVLDANFNDWYKLFSKRAKEPNGLIFFLIQIDVMSAIQCIENGGSLVGGNKLLMNSIIGALNILDESEDSILKLMGGKSIYNKKQRGGSHLQLGFMIIMLMFFMCISKVYSVDNTNCGVDDDVCKIHKLLGKEWPSKLIEKFGVDFVAPSEPVLGERGYWEYFFGGTYRQDQYNKNKKIYDDEMVKYNLGNSAMAQLEARERANEDLMLETANFEADAKRVEARAKNTIAQRDLMNTEHILNTYDRNTVLERENASLWTSIFWAIGSGGIISYLIFKRMWDERERQFKIAINNFAPNPDRADELMNQPYRGNPGRREIMNGYGGRRRTKKPRKRSTKRHRK